MVILGDGEFDGTDWQRAISDYKWKYVLRTAKNITLEDERGEKYSPAELGVEEGESLFVENLRFGKDRYGPVNILIWHGKGHEQPLFLVTNMDDGFFVRITKVLTP